MQQQRHTYSNFSFGYWMNLQMDSFPVGVYKTEFIKKLIYNFLCKHSGFTTIFHDGCWMEKSNNPPQANQVGNRSIQNRSADSPNPINLDVPIDFIGKGYFPQFGVYWDRGWKIGQIIGEILVFLSHIRPKISKMANFIFEKWFLPYFDNHILFVIVLVVLFSIFIFIITQFKYQIPRTIGFVNIQPQPEQTSTATDTFVQHWAISNPSKQAPPPIHFIQHWAILNYYCRGPTQR